MPKEQQSEHQAASSEARSSKADEAGNVRAGNVRAGNVRAGNVRNTTHASTGISAEVAQPSLSLEDMSRIMEVASTLRKERTTAQKQLNLDETKALLRQKLLETTKVTGERLTPAEVDLAIEQYYDNLHTFAEPPQSFSLMLAHLYVRRAMLLKWLLVAAAIVALVVTMLSGKAMLETQQAKSLWEASKRHAQTIMTLNDDPRLASSLQAKVDQASGARNRRDFAQLKSIEADLAKQQSLYEADYQVMILSQPGTPSATERKYADDDGNRTSGFYVFVEARNQDGSLRKMAVRNRETGNMVTVERWGEQIPESVFDRLAADKKADGILDEKLFAVKRRGQAKETIVLPGDDGQPLERRGQITSW